MRMIRQRLDALEAVTDDNHAEHIRALLRRVQACPAAFRAAGDLAEHLDERRAVRVEPDDAEGNRLIADITAAIQEYEQEQT